jgi:hypothetical protein
MQRQSWLPLQLMHAVGAEQVQRLCYRMACCASVQGMKCELPFGATELLPAGITPGWPASATTCGVLRAAVPTAATHD